MSEDPQRGEVMISVPYFEFGAAHQQIGALQFWVAELSRLVREIDRMLPTDYADVKKFDSGEFVRKLTFEMNFIMVQVDLAEKCLKSREEEAKS